MKKIIHHIRKQSETTRRHILHVMTFLSAVILLLLWIYSLDANWTSKDTEANIKQDFKPFSALKENIVNGYNSITRPNTNTE